MSEPRDLPFAHRLSTDMPSQIRGTRAPRAPHPSRPRVAAVALVLAVVGGLGLLANVPDEAQVLTTQYCQPSSATDGAGSVDAEPLVC
jgi:hypothetical protein